MAKRTKKEKIFYYSMPGLYLRKIEELEIVEEKICWLFYKFPYLRNNDNLLIFKYWQMNDNYNGELDDKIIADLTSPESIRRCRQKIQNVLGLFLPTDPKVINARKICEEAVRDWAINKKKVYENGECI